MANNLVFVQTHISHTNSKLSIFGSTLDSRPVHLVVSSFYQFFYVKPNSVIDDIEFELLKQFYNDKNTNKIIRSERVKKCNFYGYSKENVEFYKIYFENPNINAAKVAFESGLVLQTQISKKIYFEVIESFVPYVLRFMIEKELSGMSFLQIFDYEEDFDDDDFEELVKLQKNGNGDVFDAKSKVLKIHAHEKNVFAHSPVSDLLPKLKILSFDIECIGRGDSFPNAQTDPVIQIGNTVCFSNNQELCRKVIFTLGTCNPIPDTEVYSFNEEKEMILAWHSFFNTIDPDIIIGYNIRNFDFPYLFDRANVLKIKQFTQLGRTKEVSKIRDSFLSSKQFGAKNSKSITIEGRLIFDLLDIIRRDFNLRSYTLNAVSVHFLNEQKEDVPYSSMKKLQNGNAETRKRIAVYCLCDTYLPVRLFFRLNVLANYTEMARVTGVPIEFLSSRGQAIKVMSQILRKTKRLNFIVQPKEVDGTYEGGFVMEPKKGYYSKPISVLDFSSLYPSIMISKNLCYTTLVDKKMGDAIFKEHNENSQKVDLFHQIQDQTHSLLSDDLESDVFKSLKVESGVNSLSINNAKLKFDLEYKDLTKSPTGDYFVKKGIKLGVLPQILIELIDERKKAKNKLKDEKNPEIAASLNARQLALKISANSVYGFTGANLGKLPCLEISQSTTSFGREMILKTKSLIEKNYCKANDFSHDAKVIYGDTDSVMINFNEDNISKVFEMSKLISKEISLQFQKPISLEFEKVYNPFLLLNKKRYAGLVYNKPEAPSKIDTKGIETVRRDNCEMVRSVVEKCLDLILFKKDLEGAKAHVKETVENLYLNNIDLSKLVISKSLTKTSEKYLSKQAHVELAQKLRNRDKRSAPNLGDRVGYIIVKGDKHSKAYERSEDPVFVLENNLPIDIEYYVENQLAKPIFRLFEPIMDNVAGLLKGSHTTKVNRSVPIQSPLALFITKTQTCAGCKMPGSILCKSCQPKFVSIHQTMRAALNEKQMIFARCWTECQRCQGSIINEILCVNRDCPIFYKRTKTKNDLKAMETNYLTLMKYKW